MLGPVSACPAAAQYSIPWSDQAGTNDLGEERLHARSLLPSRLQDLIDLPEVTEARGLLSAPLA